MSQSEDFISLRPTVNLRDVKDRYNKSYFSGLLELRERDTAPWLGKGRLSRTEGQTSPKVEAAET